MAVLITCEACGKEFRAKDSARDLMLKCPNCRTPLKVTGPRVRDHDVFISYSSRDKTTADAICAAMESRQVRCWMAPRDVPVGQDWGASIIDAIAESRVMILVFSANSNMSQQVIREVERAVAKSVTVLPFRIESVEMSKSLEYFLSSCHWLDAFNQPMDEPLKKLVARVKLLLLDDSAAERASAAIASSAPVQPAASTAPTDQPPHPSTIVAAPKSPVRWIAAAALVVIIAMIVVGARSRFGNHRAVASSAPSPTTVASTSAPA